MIDEIIIEIVRDLEQRNIKRKREKVKVLIIYLIKNHKIHNQRIVYDYCIRYLDCCKNVINEAVKELQQKNMITIKGRLLDTRKNLMFINE